MPCSSQCYEECRVPGDPRTCIRNYEGRLCRVDGFLGGGGTVCVAECPATLPFVHDVEMSTGISQHFRRIDAVCVARCPFDTPWYTVTDSGVGQRCGKSCGPGLSN